ncbi:hypothetical protein CLG94_02980 [Candidatus Methylomirabilis limnetica]|uniref:Glycosyltransferase 2-like domain-containing protein n=1 Tax=Candidatus Methylomirabilis limnetica TaxID=2033718 RepID=A0A2T4TZZ9_9BACT|nr:Gfo/Idh/MocA family oxidoreductase [Candidatus Methylomirabilis limnetica]PTL36661.1 hypothetical protein CLG94_02980 [Candidatus Methylomirabilis limnetica]
MLSAAVIGCGPRGIEHACALKSVIGLELVAVVDQSAPALRTAIDSLGVPGYLDVKELVERHRPDIVICATPARGRADLVMQLAPFPGIRAIVVEKPMAVTLAEAELMLGACTARGILLTVCHQLRFCDEFIAMKAAIDAGELGRIEFLRGSCYGNLLNQGPHLLDAIRWFAGTREILWIMSQWSDDPDLLARYTQGDQGYRNDDSHPAPMWMTHYLAFEGGLRATLETGLLYQRSGTFRGDWLQKRVSVTGSNGQAECQAAGYFRIISSERPGPEVRDGSIERYRAATRAFHEELRDALEAGIPHRNDAKDALKTLEAVIGCAQSAVDDAMAVLPLARDRDPVSELETFRQAVRRDTLAFGSRRTIRISERIDRDVTEPDISVIVTLPDDRGLAQECVKSWVHGQTYPRERFQLIVVTDGSDPNRDDRVKALLGPGDEFICHHTSNELHLYDLGARRAKGKLLFITEPHCIAERECLEELSAFFSTHDYDGACCRSIGICSNVMARMEEQLFETGFRLFSQRGDWRKVILRGFAVYRDTYLEEGGFEYAYGRFAEWAFAAKLHSRGRRLGYAAGAAVRHEYTTSFRELFPFVREFTRGECAYRLSALPAYCEHYFGCAPEWSARELLRPSVARSACRAAWRSLWSGFRDGVGRAMFEVQAKTFLQTLPIALLGPRWRVFEAAWALQIARARSRMWRLNDRRLFRAYSDAYERMVRYSRLEYIAEYLASSGPVLSESYDYRVAEVSEERLVGFHALEQWEKESFRWSGPVSMVRISLAVASYEVQIDTRSLRRAPVPLCLSIFFNRVKLPSSSVQFKDGFVSFSIQPSMFVDGREQRLILTCNPVRPWMFGVPDRRELGLPIFSIVFQPVE